MSGENIEQSLRQEAQRTVLSACAAAAAKTETEIGDNRADSARDFACAASDLASAMRELTEADVRLLEVMGHDD